MNTLKKLALTGTAAALTAEQSFAAITTNTVDQRLIGTSGGTTSDIVTTATNILNGLLGFLALLATGYALYGGFLMVTAAGDEEKVKKGKNILIQVILGIAVIIVSYSIVNWAVTFFAKQ